MAEKFRRYGTLILLVVAAVWLACFPVAECFDCEGSTFWGQPDQVRRLHGLEATVLMIGFSVLAGVLRPRFAWIVPVGLSTIYVLTMHLAGVSWESLKYNEGPIEYFLFMPIDFVALAIGVFLGYMFPRLRQRMTARFREG